MSSAKTSPSPGPRHARGHDAHELLTVGPPARPSAWFSVGVRRDRDTGAIGCIFSAILTEDVLVLEGELDLATAAVFARALEDVDATVGLGRITVDLRPLEFMDCTGLRILLRAATRARRTGGHLALQPGSGGPARLLGICGLDAVVALLSAREGEPASDGT